jgi:hypothetical protein
VFNSKLNILLQSGLDAARTGVAHTAATHPIRKGMPGGFIIVR